MPNAVADLLSALAAEAPLVIVVDDLHDATAETIDALGLTLSRLAGPVLVLLLGRPELVRTAGALTRVADAEVHALPPLRGADAARLLTSYLSGGRLPPADADRLLATAQGNPFYLAELVTLLIERGALTRWNQVGRPRRSRRAGSGLDPAGGWRPARWAAGCSPGTSPPCSPPASTRCRPTRGRCCGTRRSSATPCRPVRWRRCASSAPAGTADRRRWSRSSWSGPSRSCCNGGCCTAPAAGTRSPPR